MSASNNKTVIAEVVGDFMPATHPASLESKVFMYPFEPSTDEMVKNQMEYAIVVDKTKIGTGGCSQIGVNYQSF